MNEKIGSVLVGAVILFACSPASVSNATLTIEQACTDSANARCALFATCGAAVPALRYGDGPTCVARVAAQCVAGASAPETGSTPLEIEACVQVLSSWSCDDYLNNEAPPPACWQKLGFAKSGATCGFAAQCETGFCAIAPGYVCGVCAPAPSPGDSCKTLTTCGLGLTCTKDTFTCIAFGGAGASCGTGAYCGTGLTCVGSNDALGVYGTCQTAVTTLNAPCVPLSLGGPDCNRDDGLACDTGSKTCVQAAIVGAGQACSGSSAQIYCAAEGSCDATSKTCLSAADGDACDVVSGPPCIPPARCISNGSGTSSCQIEVANACSGQ